MWDVYGMPALRLFLPTALAHSDAGHAKLRPMHIYNEREAKLLRAISPIMLKSWTLAYPFTISIEYPWNWTHGHRDECQQGVSPS